MKIKTILVLALLASTQVNGSALQPKQNEILQQTKSNNNRDLSELSDKIHKGITSSPHKTLPIFKVRSIKKTIAAIAYTSAIISQFSFPLVTMAQDAAGEGSAEVTNSVNSVIQSGRGVSNSESSADLAISGDQSSSSNSATEVNTGSNVSQNSEYLRLPDPAVVAAGKIPENALVAECNGIKLVVPPKGGSDLRFTVWIFGFGRTTGASALMTEGFESHIMQQAACAMGENIGRVVEIANLFPEMPELEKARTQTYLNAYILLGEYMSLQSMLIHEVRDNVQTPGFKIDQ